MSRPSTANTPAASTRRDRGKSTAVIIDPDAGDDRRADAFPQQQHHNSHLTSTSGGGGGGGSAAAAAMMMSASAVGRAQSIAGSMSWGEDVAAGRIVIELLEACPRTAANFLELCSGQHGWDLAHGNVKLDYADTRASRILPGVGAVFGDLCGLSLASTGGTLPDEGFALRHNARGVVTMVSSGPNTVGSLFMITFDRVPQCDFKHIPFARVIEGFPVLDKIEHSATTITNVPMSPIVITLCGPLNGKRPMPPPPQQQPQPRESPPPAATPTTSDSGASGLREKSSVSPTQDDEAVDRDDEK